MPSLERLVEDDFDVAAVVTNPDRPAGRGLDPRPSPVKEAALAHGLDVRQPTKMRDPELAEWLRSLDVDAAVVVAYGRILPPHLLEIPRLGFVNVHFSLLPLYRGAAPVQRAVMECRDTTGVSIMVLTEGMDEGPVLATEEIPLDDRDTAGTVGDKLAPIGAELLATTLRGYARGNVEPREQDHARATYAPKITPEEARIDWSRPSTEIDCHVRGLNPVPGAWTRLQGKRLKVLEAIARPDPTPGAGALVDPARLVVGTGAGTLELVRVQMEGRKAMTGVELARGARLTTGEHLG